MIVELSAYVSMLSMNVNLRCERMKSERRPPLVIPYRRGRYLPNGLTTGAEGTSDPDDRTLALTHAFDTLWKEAEKAGQVIPQLNTETCIQELSVPLGLDLPDTMGNPQFQEAWLMRSPYCGTHLVRFPSLGAITNHTITFVPHLPEQVMDPMTIQGDALVDVTDWPVGSLQVIINWRETEGAFTVKLR